MGQKEFREFSGQGILPFCIGGICVCSQGTLEKNLLEFGGLGGGNGTLHGRFDIFAGEQRSTTFRAPYVNFVSWIAEPSSLAL